MPEYVRPPIPAQRFYGREGAVIDYGRRWRGMPPDSSYSVVSHPERFAPLHSVADALIDYLTRNYVVAVKEDVSFAADLLHAPRDVVRAVRLIPAGDDEAPLTFIYTSFPGVVVHAGLLHDFPFPECGCDACDESVDAAAAGLESTVLAVADGRFREWYDPGADLPMGYELGSPDGVRRGGRNGDLAPDRLGPAAERLQRLTSGWRPWTHRTA